MPTFRYIVGYYIIVITLGVLILTWISGLLLVIKEYTPTKRHLSVNMKNAMKHLNILMHGSGIINEIISNLVGYS